MNTDDYTEARLHAAGINSEVNQLRHALRTKPPGPLAQDVLLDLRRATYSLGLLLEELTRRSVGPSTTPRPMPDRPTPPGATSRC